MVRLTHASAIAQVEAFLRDRPTAASFCARTTARDPVTAKVPHEGVREAFQARFGGRPVCPRPRSLDRVSPDAIRDAAVDFFLLPWYPDVRGVARQPLLDWRHGASPPVDSGWAGLILLRRSGGTEWSSFALMAQQRPHKEGSQCAPACCSGVSWRRR